MNSSKQVFSFTWQGLDIEVRYLPSWSESFERIYGYPMAHLEIQQLDHSPLPFTETGYKSHFTAMGDIEAAGGPEAYARQWLDWAAQEPAWRIAQVAARQLALF
jgi:hypothetical protein